MSLPPSVGFKVLTAVTMMSVVVWNVMPCSLAEIYDISEERTVYIFIVEKYGKKVNRALFMFVSLAHSSTLKMEALRFFEVSVKFHRIT
jgi:hypothetical protein